MKKLLFNEASTLATRQQTIVPTNPVLWGKVNSLFELQEQPYLITYYESLGGRWRIKGSALNEKFGEKQNPVVRFKDPLPNKDSAKEKPVEVHKTPVASKPVAEEYEEDGAYGLKNDEQSKLWLKRMKERRPSLYNKIKNWD
jgi:hypothetical protein